MKRIFIAVFSFMIALGTLGAQDLKKDLKSANKLAAKYNASPEGNKALLDEAVALLDGVLASEEGKMNAVAYLAKADMLAKVSDNEVNQTILKPDYKLININAAIDAAEAYKQAAEVAVKKGHTKSAYAGLTTVENTLSNYGITLYQAGDNLGAYNNFAKSLEIGDVLKAAGKSSRLDADTLKSDLQYYALICGYTAELGTDLLPLLNTMESQNSDKPIVYQLLYELHSKTDKDKALTFLEKGRKMFPDDTGMLFAEINYYLQEQKFDQLITKLELAIEAEPNNVSVYNTMGNVYEQLMKKETDAGNAEGVQVNFDKALDYYKQGLAVDEESHDALYSVGALYYNKAASYTEKINEYAQDFSADGTKKYNDLKTQMDDLFNEAYPFFEKAAKANPEDLNTLTALREMEVRKGNLDVAAELKAKIDALQAAGGN